MARSKCEKLMYSIFLFFPTECMNHPGKFLEQILQCSKHLCHCELFWSMAVISTMTQFEKFAHICWVPLSRAIGIFSHSFHSTTFHITRRGHLWLCNIWHQPFHTHLWSTGPSHLVMEASYGWGAYMVWIPHCSSAHVPVPDSCQNPSKRGKEFLVTADQPDGCCTKYTINIFAHRQVLNSMFTWIVYGIAK